MTTENVSSDPLLGHQYWRRVVSPEFDYRLSRKWNGIETPAPPFHGWASLIVVIPEGIPCETFTGGSVGLICKMPSGSATAAVPGPG